MTKWEIKEANRLFWMVKGHLIPTSWSEKDVNAIYESYFRRLWGNHEAGRRAAGFETAWKEREAKIYNEEIKTIAILGGHYD